MYHIKDIPSPRRAVLTNTYVHTKEFKRHLLRSNDARYLVQIDEFSVPFRESKFLHSTCRVGESHASAAPDKSRKAKTLYFTKKEVNFPPVTTEIRGSLPICDFAGGHFCG